MLKAKTNPQKMDFENILEELENKWEDLRAQALFIPILVGAGLVFTLVLVFCSFCCCICCRNCCCKKKVEKEPESPQHNQLPRPSTSVPLRVNIINELQQTQSEGRHGNVTPTPDHPSVHWLLQSRYSLASLHYSPETAALEMTVVDSGNAHAQTQANAPPPSPTPTPTVPPPCDATLIREIQTNFQNGKYPNIPPPTYWE